MIQITQKPGEEVPTEVLADSIVTISAGIKKLRSGRLNDKALIILIQHAIPTDSRGQRTSQSDIRAVLDGIAGLERTFIRPPATQRKQ